MTERRQQDGMETASLLVELSGGVGRRGVR